MYPFNCLAHSSANAGVRLENVALASASKLVTR